MKENDHSIYQQTVCSFNRLSASLHVKAWSTEQAKMAATSFNRLSASLHVKGHTICRSSIGMRSFNRLSASLHVKAFDRTGTTLENQGFKRLSASLHVKGLSSRPSLLRRTLFQTPFGITACERQTALNLTFLAIVSNAFRHHCM